MRYIPHKMKMRREELGVWRNLDKMKRNLLEEDKKYFKSLINKANGFIDTFPTNVTESTAKNSRTTFSILDLDYNITAFCELLIQEDYIEDIEEANVVMRMICSETLKKFAQPLLEKRFDERLTYINNLINSVTITKDMILGDSLSQKYIETEYIILGLTYEKLSPLILFEDFVSFYNIRILVDKEAHSFSYRFTRDTPLIEHDKCSEWYCAKNFYQMCEHFHNVLLEGVVSNVLRFIELGTNSITIDLKEFIDIKYTSDKSPQEIYDYLKNIEVARMSLPLEYIYLLLNFRNFLILKDETIMDRIIEALTEDEPEPDDEKGFTYAILRKIIHKLIVEKIA